MRVLNLQTLMKKLAAGVVKALVPNTIRFYQNLKNGRQV